MKIGIYNDWWSPDLVGGAERSALSVSSELTNVFGRDQIVVFTLSNRLRSNNIDLTGAIPIQRIGSFTLRKRYLVPTYIRILERFRILFDFVTPYRVAHAAYKANITIIVVHNVDRLGLKFLFLVSKFFRIHTIRVVHDLSDICINRTRFRNKTNCKKTCLTCKPKSFFYKIAMLRLYDLVVFNSLFSLTKFNSLKFKAKEMDYGYILPETLSYENPITKRIANLEKIRIGYVGRVSPEKGLELVIKALQILQSSSSSTVELIVIGTGTTKYITSLVKLARESSVSLEMYGYIDNPYDFIRSKVDLIVVPSLWEETLGRVAYEASMAGFPVLVSRIGGLPESASLAGKNYFEFEPSNYFDLSRQISGFYSGNDHGIIPSLKHRKLTSALIRKISELSGN